MLMFLAYALLGLVAGVFSGLVGVGGGIILVPAMVFFFGLSQQSAQGTTLALLCLPIGLLGALQYYRHGHVELKLVGLIALGFLLGSFFGAKLALALPTEVLKKVFGGTMLIVGLKMLLGF